MTKMVYTVVRRPKKIVTGVTDIGWKEDGASSAVPRAGFLITSRTKRGEKRKYTAYLSKSISDDYFYISKKHLGDEFETRAQAAFAIWRSYYEYIKIERRIVKLADEQERDKRRQDRLNRKKFRSTPEGQQAYRDELNHKARIRRAAMTPEEKMAVATKRKEKRRLKNMI